MHWRFQRNGEENGGVTGNTGIVILLVVPVVSEGMDNVGRELIGMPRE